MKGNVEQRGKRSWRLTAYLGYDPGTGEQNRPRKTVNAETKKQAEKLLREWIIELERGILPRDGQVTVEQFSKEWLQKHCTPNLQPKTVHTYSEKLKVHILPALGKIRLCDLTPKHIIDFTNRLHQADQRKDQRNVADKKLSDRTILHCFRILSSMLQIAVNWQVISTNPARNVKPPKVTAQKAAVYDESVVQKICAALKEEPTQYRLMIIMDLYTGLRNGELLGLSWNNIDFENGELNVQQTAQYIPGKGTFIKPVPKNKSSERVIALNDVIKQMLKQHQYEQDQLRSELSNNWLDHNLVFTKWNGKPFLPNVLSNWFPKFLQRHSLVHLRFHDLRHYNITFLLSLGIPIHNIQSHTGHAKASTLLDIYGHALKSGNKLIAEKLVEAIPLHI